MSSGHNPWTSIADLLSGFVVVLLLLFVTAALLPHFQQKAEAQVREETRRDVMVRLAGLMKPAETQGLVRVDVDQRIVEFSDVSFKNGSACLTDPASAAVKAIAPLLADQLRADRSLVIQVEGHADPADVRRLVKSCGYFDNNTQLSALRATNVREIIAADAGGAARQRLPVTGWGSDRLRNTVDVFAPENRRVELHLVWRDEASTEAIPVAPPLAAAGGGDILDSMPVAAPSPILPSPTVEMNIP